jgi:hypothetical protein
VTIKARVLEKIFSFCEASASFQAERFFGFWLSYRSADDLACKRLFRPITVSCLFYFIIFCVLGRRATSFSILFSFFLGKQGEARGNGPADRGRRRRIAPRTISGFIFGSPPFF